MGDELTLDELARRTGEPVERLRHWRSLGLIGDEGGDGFRPEDVERARLVQALLRRGIGLEAVARADREQAFLSHHMELMFPGGVAPSYSLAEAAEILDLDLELLRRVWASYGFVQQGDAVSEEDLECLRAMKVAMEAGFPEEALLQLTRVYADALGRVAETETRLFHFYVHERLKGAGLSGPERHGGHPHPVPEGVEARTVSARRKSDDDLLRELTAQSDGLPVRSIKPHTLKKLSVLLLYFKPFTQIVGGGYYVDGLAGPGLCEVKDVPPPTRFVWGSPLLALKTKPGFERCWFVELDSNMADALASRTRPILRRSEVRPGDVNDLVPRIVRDEIPSGAPCFCFLDPEATEVYWSTVSQVAQAPGRRKMPEILINFPLDMAFQRLLTTRTPMDAASIAKADRFLPGPQWREVHDARLRKRISRHEARQQYLNLYKKGLEGLGYKPDRIHDLLVKTPSLPGRKGHPLYHLVFASNHEKGSEIMDYVLKRQNWVDRIVMGYRPLIPPEA